MSESSIEAKVPRFAAPQMKLAGMLDKERVWLMTDEGFTPSGVGEKRLPPEILIHIQNTPWFPAWHESQVSHPPSLQSSEHNFRYCLNVHFLLTLHPVGPTSRAHTRLQSRSGRGPG